MVYLILKRMNSAVKPTILNQSTNEIPKQYLSAKKARRLLSWKPQYRLEEGIDKTIHWYKDLFKKDLKSIEKKSEVKK